MVDFCIYTPNDKDYWGQVTNKEFFEMLDKEFPGWEIDPKASNDARAHYKKNDALIVAQFSR